MHVKRFILIILIVLHIGITNLLGQSKEAENWYFGNHAAVNFSSGSPVAVTNSAMDQGEGCATISDEDGNLLFYTDGMTVWNRNNEIMHNGSGLQGHISATQSGVIIQKPNSDNIYYIFTVLSYDEGGKICYSTTDMTQGGGNGSIVSKNNLLYTGSSERITAVTHANGDDIWVITRKMNSSSFYSYLVTNSGVNSNEVISNCGQHIGSGPSAVGYLKAAPSGDKLAMAVTIDNKELGNEQIESRGNGYVELLDFNSLTGEVSNAIKIEGSTSQDSPYGIAFSPNQQYLYFSSFYEYEVYQTDITLGSVAAINNSTTLVVTTDNYTGALQIGLDNKLYISIATFGYLSCIENPNSSAASLVFTKEAVFLDGGIAMYGLPTFNQSYFLVSDFTYKGICEGSPTQFIITDPEGILSVLWDFGDPSTGSQNQSTSLNPSHLFSSNGTFTVTLTITYQSGDETATKEIEISALPTVDLGGNFTICEGEDILLDAGPGFKSYLWQDGSNNQTYLASNAQLYSVTVTNEAECSASDNTSVVVEDLPTQFTMTGGGEFCEGSAGLQIGLSDSEIGVSYKLYKDNSATGDQISGTGNAISFGIFTTPGTYSAKAISNNIFCENSMLGTAEIIVIPAPTSYNISTGGNLCEGGVGLAITLSGSELGFNYELFRDDITTSIIKAGTGNELNFGDFTTAGNYTIVAQKSGCSSEMNGICTIIVNQRPPARTIHFKK